jgi:hypothetical protein
MAKKTTTPATDLPADKPVSKKKAPASAKKAETTEAKPVKKKLSLKR